MGVLVGALAVVAGPRPQHGHGAVIPKGRTDPGAVSDAFLRHLLRRRPCRPSKAIALAASHEARSQAPLPPSCRPVV